MDRTLTQTREAQRPVGSGGECWLLRVPRRAQNAGTQTGLRAEGQRSRWRELRGPDHMKLHAGHRRSEEFQQDGTTRMWSDTGERTCGRLSSMADARPRARVFWKRASRLHSYASESSKLPKLQIPGPDTNHLPAAEEQGSQREKLQSLNLGTSGRENGPSRSHKEQT